MIYEKILINYFMPVKRFTITIILSMFSYEFALCDITEHLISTTANGACSVYAADMDGDGNMDVLSATVQDHKISWYQNDGNENFIEHVISTSAIGAYSVLANGCTSYNFSVFCLVCYINGTEKTLLL